MSTEIPSGYQLIWLTMLHELHLTQLNSLLSKTHLRWLEEWDLIQFGSQAAIKSLCRTIPEVISEVST